MADKNIQAIYPLTPLQEGILFHTLESPGSGVYFNQFTCRIEGPLDSGRIRDAWQAAFARHPALRTLFTWEKRDRPLQIVRARVDLPFEELDWRQKDSTNRDSDFEALLAADRDEGFSLDVAPLSRITLIRLDSDVAQMVWSFHHISLDGWSVRLVFDEVMASYRGGAAGYSDAAPTFEAFVRWQKDRDQSREQTFWQQRLGGFEALTTPEIRLHGDDSDTRGGRPGQQTTLSSGEELGRRLAAFAREQRVTLSSVVAAAWSVVLSRYCDSDDVVFGTTVSGRAGDLDGMDRIVGLLINTLPLRVTVDEDTTVSGLLRDVQSQQVDQQAFEQTPLNEILRSSGAASPLFETILVFENLPEADTSDGLRVTGRRFIEHSNFPLALLVVPGEELEFIAVHDGRRYSTGAAEQMLNGLVHVLGQMAAADATRVSEISATSPAAQARSLEFARGEARPVRDGMQSVVQLIEEHVEQTPDAVALAEGDDVETYASLARKANALARRLVDRHQARGMPVVIYAKRSIEAIVAMLAALRGGAVYVPLDVNEPAARLRQVVADLAQRFPSERDVRPLILTQAEYIDDMPTDIAEATLIADDDSAEDEQDFVADLNEDDPAYVIYTSGSTGEPKGVLVQHGALLNSNLARLEFYDEPPASFALLSSLATDSSLAGIYWTLCTGGKLVIPAPRAELDIEQLSALILKHEVSQILCVPTLYTLILDNADLTRLRSLRAAIVAGEACTESLVERHSDLMPDTALFNEYGPSEACVWATAAKLEPGPVGIGRPIANTTAYVLDDERRIVPQGVAGELCIGGDNVTLGYLGRPDETARAFVEDPFAADGSRMYRTGDRARFWSDGRLEFLGRRDQQIKVRGFRIEPGEVEAALSTHPDVDEAVVYKRSAAAGEQLVAAVAGSGARGKDLRGYCEGMLPMHMVPQQFAVLERMPRTPAGKTDRDAARKAATFEEMPDRERTEPRTPLEHKLAEIWRSVMGLSEIGIHDNFFEIGGDSLMTIRILSRAAREGLKIAPERFFEHPTIAAQAVLAEQLTDAVSAAEDDAGLAPLLPIQQWFFREIRTDRHQWNHSYLFEVDASVSTEQLDEALTAIVQRHAALRTQFAEGESGWSAEVVEAADVAVERVELAGDERERIEDIAARLNAGFDLARAPLLNACHFVGEAGGSNRLLLVIHHLVVDVESWRILIGDLEARLRQALGASAEPVRASTPVSLWAKRLRSLADSAELDDDRAYWTGRLQGTANESQANGSNREKDAVIRSFVIDRDTTDSLAQATTGPLRASMYQMLLSGLARAVAGWSENRTVVLDTEGHGREPLFDDCDVTGTVGWLTSSFPLVFEADDATWNDPVAALRHVKQRVGGIPGNGISYGILSELADPADRGIERHDGADLLFNYLGQVDVAAEEDALLKLKDTRCGPARSPNCERAYPLEINASLSRGELTIEMAFSGEMFTAESIERLGSGILQAMRELAKADAESNATVSSDFPMANLSASDFESVAAQLDALDE